MVIPQRISVLEDLDQVETKRKRRIQSWISGCLLLAVCILGILLVRATCFGPDVTVLEGDRVTIESNGHLLIVPLEEGQVLEVKGGNE